MVVICTPDADAPLLPLLLAPLLFAVLLLAALLAPLLLAAPPGAAPLLLAAPLATAPLLLLLLQERPPAPPGPAALMVT
jgi:hypothetical protein